MQAMQYKFLNQGHSVAGPPVTASSMLNMTSFARYRADPGWTRAFEMIHRAMRYRRRMPTPSRWRRCGPGGYKALDSALLPPHVGFISSPSHPHSFKSIVTGRWSPICRASKYTEALQSSHDHGTLLTMRLLQYCRYPYVRGGVMAAAELRRPCAPNLDDSIRGDMADRSRYPRSGEILAAVDEKGGWIGLG